MKPNRNKDGNDHNHWSLVETVRTADGPRQRTMCYLGELNGSAQARWLKGVEVFNEQGEAQQLNLFPSHVEPTADDPQLVRVLVNRVRLGENPPVRRRFSGLEVVEGRGTGSPLRAGGGQRSGGCTVVAWPRYWRPTMRPR